jgi:hypothetical protein
MIMYLLGMHRARATRARLCSGSVFPGARSFPELKYNAQLFIPFGLFGTSIEPRNDRARERTGISRTRLFSDL